MSIQEDISLQKKNTLGLKSIARFFTTVRDRTSLQAALSFAEFHHLDIVILGSGSNVVLPPTVNALVIEMGVKGKQIISRQEDASLVSAGAGENWDEFVHWTIRQNLYGLENLSLIPGTVGAAPVQNIGAYGVEISQHFYQLEAWDRKRHQFVTLSEEDCRFGYRHSIFKIQQDRYIILSVVFRLIRHFSPVLSYSALQTTFQNRNSIEAEQVRQTICKIRSQKLPDPVVLPNAGSFFKNPVITEEKLTSLKSRYSDIIAYPQSDGRWKLAAGWLIDKAGLKGFQTGSVGTYKTQALVLVNYGEAIQADIITFAGHVQNRIKQLFGVSLSIEPRVYPSRDTPIIPDKRE
ncbi:UDP-N-acetylenolpyruvoylglucosamine reductase [invertebrate metagenome]|uniref:UDP-N-acetylmuramate dehydrogenase n=1 Tax=invertebrate metagenome TaxID=1711999 RepID=A0A2H9T8K7_9ZZZZ